MNSIKSGIKGLGKGLKLIYLALGSGILIVSAYFFIQTSSPKYQSPQASSSQALSSQTLSSQALSPLSLNPQLSSAQASTSQATESNIEPKVQSSKSTFGTTNRFKPKRNKRSEPINDNEIATIPQKSSTNIGSTTRYSKKSNQAAEIGAEKHDGQSQDLSNSNRIDLTDSTLTNNNISNQAESSIFSETESTPSLNLVQTNTYNFAQISPLNLKPNLEFVGPLPNQMPLKPHEEHQQFIRHLTVSPYMGLVRQIQDQSVTNSNLTYLQKPQNNLTFGIQVEASFKHFALRSGLGYSVASLQSQLTSSHDLYQVDTSYIIVNANYGTTLSGKPVVLIKQQFDSTLMGTQQNTLEDQLSCTYVTVPLVLQYHISFGRFGVIMEAGTLNHFGINRLNNFPSISESKISIPNYNMQATAGAGLRYALNVNWAIGVQYNYEHNFKMDSIRIPGNAHLATFMVSRFIW